MFSLFILLVLVASNCPSQATTGDVSGVAEGETSFYHGTINQTLEVELTLTRKGNTITGTYEYVLISRLYACKELCFQTGQSRFQGLQLEERVAASSYWITCWAKAISTANGPVQTGTFLSSPSRKDG